MKTVAGPTDRIIVVGAGLAGLSAALHLTGAGRAVTVLERADHPGGRVGVYRGPDYEIDCGATILTVPDLIDEALGAVGTDARTQGLRIRRLDPGYRARFADGSTIAVFSDPERMAAEVERACGPAAAGRYRELRKWLGRIYEAAFDEFMDTNFDSPLDMVRIPAKRAALADLVRLGAFGRLGPKVGRLLREPRLARLFSFQALFAGLAPAQALAVYGAIPHMDTSLGVYFPEGGMREVTATLARALVAAGGRLELNTEATGIDYTGGRARRVRCADGRAFDCDAVVLTADLGALERFGVRPRRLRAAPSAVVAHGTIPAEVAAAWPVQAHHTIDFGAAWDRTFAEIAGRRGRLMSDPSLLLTRPALTDPGLFVDRADGRHEPLSLLAPCPNLDAAPLDWVRLGPAYLRELLAVLEARGYRGIAARFTVDHLDTPRTWRDRGMLAGTPFSAAHLFGQTGPFRTRNLPLAAANVVLAGCGTTPGVGVPTTLLSGKLAAQRITGDPRPTGTLPGRTGALMFPADY
ncbi:phytoene desaturase family protein [Nocardia sp. CDC159]|uniref:Phytoene desaturase family protein n=1 Tax=Nocardia pulmonis TaxID=2951408 RepID=A0A9X2E8E0_9NOCA|nr:MULTISPECIES: phytoene desaturase family protein [Nocardia]MCM6773353.1 phytoene desaturase family protein [Nocardia pulmonis]MCM6786240.1 phytoene desaturase family protein [Nocardia sp. CDC159]